MVWLGKARFAPLDPVSGELDRRHLADRLGMPELGVVDVLVGGWFDEEFKVLFEYLYEYVV